MRQFIAKDWFHIRTVGDVAAVVNDEDFAKDSPHMIDETVQIDGQEYVVRGIEANCIKTIRKGVAIGILVRGGRKPASGPG